MIRYNRSTLLRKTLRDLYRYKWRVLSIIVALSAGIGITAGMDMTTQTLRATRDAIYRECRANDMEIYLIPTDLTQIPDLEELDTVDHAERRLVLPGIADFKDRSGCTAQILLFERSDPKVNQLTIVSGQGLTTEDTSGVVVEQSYANFHGIDIGDTLLLHIGQALYPSYVRGIAQSAEHICVMPNPMSYLPREGSVAIVFGTLDRFTHRMGFGIANSILVSLKKNVDPSTAITSISDHLVDLPLEGIIPRERQFSYHFLEMDLHALDIYIPAAQITLGLLSLLIAIINAQRMVAVQRWEVGILRSLGYGYPDIIGSFMIAGFFIGFCGLIFGIPATIGLRNAFSEIYGEAIGLFRVDQHFFIYSYFLPGTIALFLPVVTLCIAVGRLIRSSPSRLLRPYVPGRKTLSQVPVWVRISTEPFGTTKRWAVRNLIRRPFLSIITILAVALSCGVAVAYRIAYRSMNETARITTEREKWDVQIEFKYPAFLEEYEEMLIFPGVIEAEPYLIIPVNIGEGNERQTAMLMGTDVRSDFRATEILSGTDLSTSSRNSVLISPNIERLLGVGAGDSLILYLPENRAKKVLVAGVTQDIVLDRVMAPLDEVRTWSQNIEKASGVFLRTDNYQTGEDWPERFSVVSNSHRKSDIIDDITALVDKEIEIVNITMLISIGVGALFLITSLNFAIGERLGEYATLRALGCNSKMIRDILQVEGMTQVILAAALSVPVGLLISIFLNGRLSRAWFPLITVVKVGDIIPSIMLMISFGYLSIILVYRQIIQSNLSSILRVRNVE